VVTAAAVVALIVGLVWAVASVFGNHGNSSPPPLPHTATAAPPAPSTTPPPPKTPSLSAPVKGADGLGFVGETARCDPGNPPAAVVRTAKSLAVVCQNLSGSYYYRGERISDGANIELSNAERASDGFDVTNPVDGTLYEVRPNRLRIISNGHVDSSEPVLQYASAS
jgi:serine/threonine-protein kinase